MFFYTVEKPPRLSEFDLEVPEKLIAKHPSKARDNCKLMVLNKKEETKEIDRNIKIEVEDLQSSNLLSELICFFPQFPPPTTQTFLFTFNL